MIDMIRLEEKNFIEDTFFVTFEGDGEDIRELIDLAQMINSVKCDYYTGFKMEDDICVVACEDDYDKADDEADTNPEADMVNKPLHYCSGKLETIEKIEAVIEGLPAKQASCLANVLKYFDRAGLKDDAVQDLDKANNYAHRLVHGVWRHEH